MLDVDLAALYGVITKNLNKAVSRNVDRFPGDFMFQLSKPEYDALRFQIGTLKRGQHAKYLPYVFTQEGVAMLSGVLRSPRAAQVNIAIMRAFVKLRHAMQAHQGISRRVEKLEGKMNMHETDIRLLVQDVDMLKKRPGPSGPINPSII
jgi:phage regulator Rha-like protein